MRYFTILFFLGATLGCVGQQEAGTQISATTSTTVTLNACELIKKQVTNDAKNRSFKVITYSIVPLNRKDEAPFRAYMLNKYGIINIDSGCMVTDQLLCAQATKAAICSYYGDDFMHVQ